MATMLSANFFLALLCASAMARDVKETNGNIYVTSDHGTLEQLTSSGSDSEPGISFDGNRVVFARARSDRDELLVIDLMQNKRAQLVYQVSRSQKNGKKSSIQAVFANIIAPQFSPDGTKIFFFSQPGNFGLVQAVDIATGAARVVAHSVIPMRGKPFEVIPSGKYAGDLIVYKDSEKLTAGRLFLYWLVSPDGRNIGIVGNDQSDVEIFRDQY